MFAHLSPRRAACRIAVTLGAVLAGLSASMPDLYAVGFVTNLALNKPVTATSSLFGSTYPRLVNGNVAEEWGWHFAAPYGSGGVPSGSNPYFGAVDMAGANNTVTVKTVRVFGGGGPNPTAWTLQSRNSAADPLDALVDSGWTDTGLGVAGSSGFFGMSHTYATPVTTRALRFRVTGMNATNDRLIELEAFSTDPHAASLNANAVLDPILSREDNVTIAAATNIDRLRDNAFNNTPPGGVATIQIDNGQPGATAVMNYDYMFSKTATIDGLRFYFTSEVGNSHASSTVELLSWDGGAWAAIPGATQSAMTGLNVFDFSTAALLTSGIRIRHTAIDINGNPRSGLYGYEIEIYGAIPEPATVALMGLALAGVVLRRRGPHPIERG